MTTFDLTSFDDFLNLAQRQDEPQRLLLVFTRPELPNGHTAEQADRFALGEGGHLAPVVCVDKDPRELKSFTALAAESRQIEQDWAVLFAAALIGQGDEPPTDEQTDQALDQMVEAIRTGRVSNFLVFDRQGQVLSLESSG